MSSSVAYNDNLKVNMTELQTLDRIEGMKQGIRVGRVRLKHPVSLTPNSNTLVLVASQHTTHTHTQHPLSLLLERQRSCFSAQFDSQLKNTKYCLPRPSQIDILETRLNTTQFGSNFKSWNVKIPCSALPSQNIGLGVECALATHTTFQRKRKCRPAPHPT